MANAYYSGISEEECVDHSWDYMYMLCLIDNQCKVGVFNAFLFRLFDIAHFDKAWMTNISVGETLGEEIIVSKQSMKSSKIIVLAYLKHDFLL